jgi:hypothetical protein
VCVCVCVCVYVCVCGVCVYVCVCVCVCVRFSIVCNLEISTVGRPRPGLGSRATVEKNLSFFLEM